MNTQHIALVPEADGVDLSDLARVSAAIQKQVVRDLAPLWSLSATVDPFPRLDDVPVGYWPVLITQASLGHGAGIHLDENGQPYAQVELKPDWSLAVSRVCLELLVNPFGQRTISAYSPRSDQGLVDFIIEVCSPCSERDAYLVNDVVVSDFATPALWRTGASGQERYSFRGAIATPFQVLKDGHLIWHDASSNCWWLRNHWAENPADINLGVLDGRVESVRELARRYRPWRVAQERVVREGEARQRQQGLEAASKRAQRLRSWLGRKLEQDAAHVTHEALEAKHESTPPKGNPLAAFALTAARAPRERNPESERPKPVPPEKVAAAEASWVEELADEPTAEHAALREDDGTTAELESAAVEVGSGPKVSQAAVEHNVTAQAQPSTPPPLKLAATQAARAYQPLRSEPIPSLAPGRAAEVKRDSKWLLVSAVTLGVLGGLAVRGFSARPVEPTLSALPVVAQAQPAAAIGAVAKELPTAEPKVVPALAQLPVGTVANAPPPDSALPPPKHHRRQEVPALDEHSSGLDEAPRRHRRAHAAALSGEADPPEATRSSQPEVTPPASDVGANLFETRE
ncbi:MAG: hypothetical protein QM778_28970 [Myxococcales bacterium]